MCWRLLLLISPSPDAGALTGKLKLNDFLMLVKNQTDDSW